VVARPSLWGSFHNGFQSGEPGSKEVYFLGIIDILQEFNMKKRAEHVMRVAKGDDGTQISCVSPEDYAQRFTTFLMNHVNEVVP